MTAAADKARSKLKKFTSEMPSEEDFKRYTKQLIDGDDRVAAVALASLLEDSLTHVLLKQFRELSKPEFNGLFGPGMPISTFAAKINLVYALKLCDKREADNMYIIKDVRNAFAHAKRNCDFQTLEIAEMCAFIRLKVFRRVLTSSRKLKSTVKLNYVSEAMIMMFKFNALKIPDELLPSP